MVRSLVPPLLTADHGLGRLAGAARRAALAVKSDGKDGQTGMRDDRGNDEAHREPVGCAARKADAYRIAGKRGAN
jgi:hypothetical protein